MCIIWDNGREDRNKRTERNRFGGKNGWILSTYNKHYKFITSKISLNFKHKRYKETVLTFLRSMMKFCMVPLCSDQNTNHPLVQCFLLLVTSVQFSHSVVSDSLWPHELQNTRPACPSPTPVVHSNSCPSCQWCHPTISSSVVPSPLSPNPSQHQSLFQRVSSSHLVAKVLQFLLQHQSFPWIFRTDFL